MFIAPGQGQSNPWGLMCSLTRLFSQLSHLLQTFPINDFVTVLHTCCLFVYHLYIVNLVSDDPKLIVNKLFTSVLFFF